MTLFTTRHAKSSDIAHIKEIADANKRALGFLPRPKVEDAIAAARVIVLLAADELAGFVIFRHRKKDMQTTLSDICVATKWRGRKGGKFLVDALYAECVDRKRNFILLKCPVDLAANRFYKKMNFHLSRTENGRVRQLNVWTLDVSETEAL